MSQHEIPNAPGSPEGCKTAVGWDAALNTFFASISQRVDDLSDESYGETPCEVPTIGALAMALAVHSVEIPVEVARSLGEDHEREGNQFANRPATGLLVAMSKAYAGPEQAARIAAALTGADLAEEADTLMSTETTDA